MYEIELTPIALEDLHYFKKYEQNIILDAIRTQLPYEPTVETTNRFRRQPQEISEWELRVGVYRVFYNVEEMIEIVRIEGIGEKPNNTILFRGRRTKRA